MMDKLKEFPIAFWSLFAEMAPYLLLGFFIAGALHVWFPKKHIIRFLGKYNLKSVVNAALIGVPLPLCSCGVIPTGISFHKNGASKSSSISFLISTPQTGIDSILVTYSLMGLPFAIIRPITAFITGIVGGQVMNTISNSKEQQIINEEQEVIKGNKFLVMLRYAFVDFLDDISKSLLVGLLVAAVITVFIPSTFFATYLSNPYWNMLLVLVASVPMYVCATGSIPIAVALMLKGISPGAAFVFLMAGPATNAGTISVIGQALGKKALISYLSSIIGGAIVFGLLINWFLPAEWFTGFLPGHHHHEGHGELDWFANSSAVALGILLLYSIVKRWIPSKQKERIMTDNEMQVKVNGMTCNHCKANVEKNLMKLDRINTAEVDLASKSVFVKGEDISEAEVKNLVNDLGYEFVEKVK